MPPVRDEDLVAAAAAVPRPAAFACVNLHNFKPFNAVLSHEKGDRLLRSVEEALRELGPTWRTKGDEFVTLVGGTLAEATDRLRSLSWLFYASVGITDAWSFLFPNGEVLPAVPWRSFQVVCTPRCGLAELTSDAADALRLARKRCGDRTAAEGFAPLSRGPWTNEKMLAERVCPRCRHPSPAILEQDLGWSKEHCSQCAARYERTELQSVLGEVSEATYG